MKRISCDSGQISSGEAPLEEDGGTKHAAFSHIREVFPSGAVSVTNFFIAKLEVMKTQLLRFVLLMTQKLMRDLEAKEKDLNKLKAKADALLKANHPASDKIEVKFRDPVL